MIQIHKKPGHQMEVKSSFLMTVVASMGGRAIVLLFAYKCHLLITLQTVVPDQGEHSGSEVECLTRDRGAASSSFTGVTVLCF